MSLSWTLPVMPLMALLITPAAGINRPKNAKAMSYGAIARIAFAVAFALIVYGISHAVSDFWIIACAVILPLIVLALWSFKKGQKVNGEFKLNYPKSGCDLRKLATSSVTA